jgi:hypothetical protein
MHADLQLSRCLKTVGGNVRYEDDRSRTYIDDSNGMTTVTAVVHAIYHQTGQEPRVLASVEGHSRRFAMRMSARKAHEVLMNTAFDAAPAMPPQLAQRYRRQAPMARVLAPGDEMTAWDEDLLPVVNPNRRGVVRERRPRSR